MELTKTHSEQCEFPARARLLFNQGFLKKLAVCEEVEQWKQNIDAGQLYLVFASAYPNNPASLFGHTFLRFNRKSKKRASAEKLLGYSLAYQALTNPDDSAPMYVWRGLTGGYQSILEVKPYYMNVGIYNNFESRDLWEYPIPLSKDEQELMLDHLWEIIHKVSYTYYFFDENCSTHLLKLLMAIKPEWDFQSVHDLMVVPQTTLIELTKNTQKKKFSVTPSIKRRIWERYHRLDLQKQAEVMEAFYQGKKLETIKNVDQADVLIDLWTLKNYKEQTHLSEDEKENYKKSLLHRATLNEKSKPSSLESKLHLLAPHQGHGFKKISLDLESGEGKWQDRMSFNIRYGFHTFSDPPAGFDEKSFINFMDFQWGRSQASLVIKKLDLVDILSLRNFSWHYPEWSWTIQSWLDHDQSKSFLPSDFNLAGGMGISKVTLKNQSFALLNLKFQHGFTSKKTYLGPMVRLGFKHIWSKDFWFVLEGKGDKLGSRYNYSVEGKLKSRLFKDIYWGIGASHQYLDQEVKALTQFDFYY